MGGGGGGGGVDTGINGYIVLLQGQEYGSA